MCPFAFSQKDLFFPIYAYASRVYVHMFIHQQACLHTHASLGVCVLMYVLYVRSHVAHLTVQAIEEAIKDEASFLKRRYPLLASKSGTPYLAKRLNKVHTCIHCL